MAHSVVSLFVMRAVAVAFVALALAGCSGGPTGTPREEGPFGQGADLYWLFRPAGEPRAVVLFLHGLHQSELSPTNHLPWLRHLAEQGDVVIYPRYEVSPGTFGALRHTLAATRAALRRLGEPKVPLVAMGYSRGGHLAVEYAAVAEMIKAVPAAVFSVFPGLVNPDAEEIVDLGYVDRSTRITILVGDRDTGVGSAGEEELVERLNAHGFPKQNLETVVIRSHGDFVADHFAPLSDSAAAQQAFWERADRLVDEIVEAS